MEVEAEAEVEEGVERAERLCAVIPNILILVSGDFFLRQTGSVRIQRRVHEYTQHERKKRKRFQCLFVTAIGRSPWVRVVPEELLMAAPSSGVLSVDVLPFTQCSCSP